MLVLPRVNLKDAGAVRVVKQMGPAILGVSVSQISLIINTILPHSSFPAPYRGCTTPIV
jgi:putative peptidoglycan lipid II flippase